MAGLSTADIAAYNEYIEWIMVMKEHINITAQGNADITYAEWVKVSREHGWVSLVENCDLSELRQSLQKEMERHDAIHDLDNLSELEKKEWDRECAYRELYLCNRISEIYAELQPGSRPKAEPKEKRAGVSVAAFILALFVSIAGIISAGYFYARSAEATETVSAMTQKYEALERKHESLILQYGKLVEKYEAERRKVLFGA